MSSSSTREKKQKRGNKTKGKVSKKKLTKTIQKKVSKKKEQGKREKINDYIEIRIFNIKKFNKLFKELSTNKLYL